MTTPVELHDCFSHAKMPFLFPLGKQLSTNVNSKYFSKLTPPLSCSYNFIFFVPLKRKQTNKLQAPRGVFSQPVKSRSTLTGYKYWPCKQRPPSPQAVPYSLLQKTTPKLFIRLLSFYICSSLHVPLRCHRFSSLRGWGANRPPFYTALPFLSLYAVRP